MSGLCCHLFQTDDGVHALALSVKLCDIHPFALLSHSSVSLKTENVNVFDTIPRDFKVKHWPSQTQTHHEIAWRKGRQAEVCSVSMRCDCKLQSKWVWPVFQSWQCVRKKCAEAEKTYKAPRQSDNNMIHNRHLVLLDVSSWNISKLTHLSRCLTTLLKHFTFRTMSLPLWMWWNNKAMKLECEATSPIILVCLRLS